jgi:hypothetical protein
MEIAKWNKRREEYIIVALGDLSNIGEHNSFGRLCPKRGLFL